MNFIIRTIAAGAISIAAKIIIKKIQESGHPKLDQRSKTGTS